MKRKIIVTIFGLIVTLSIYLFTADFSPIATKSNHAIDSFVQDSGQIQLFFCPQEQCEEAFISFLDSGQESIHCALYEIDLPSVQQKLLEKQQQMEVQIITDDDYLKEFNHSFVKADSFGLMHNKFCVIDGIKVSSGSMNPTINDAHKNNNNLLLIDSPLLAKNYDAEFQEMWNGTFKKGTPVKNPFVLLNNSSIQNYFCPDDDCAWHVAEELKQAKKSIYFMVFSFTQQSIANVLLLKHQDNISVQGVMDSQQISQYSVYEQLQYQGIDVLKDGNKYKLHHKVFIIDDDTIITGSFNPTGGGDEKNDENILIIKDKEIAQKFQEEFKKRWEEAEKENSKI